MVGGGEVFWGEGRCLGGGGAVGGGRAAGVGEGGVCKLWWGHCSAQNISDAGP